MKNESRKALIFMEKNMAIDKKKVKTLIGIGGVALGAAFIGMEALAKKKKRNSVYDNEPEQKNPLEGKKVVFVEDENDPENADGARGHLEAVGDSDYKPGFYDKYGKRAMDIVLSFGGLVLLSPIYAVDCTTKSAIYVMELSVMG